MKVTTIEPVKKMKLRTLVILFLLNAAANIFLAVCEDFAQYLRNILIGNVLLSVIKYIDWKIFWWHHTNKKARLTTKPNVSFFLFQTILYFVLALLFGMFRKFHIELTKWRKLLLSSKC